MTSDDCIFQPDYPEATAPYRFADHGELRWSLRSLDRYAPWINKVHIVTNGQVPTWLNVNHKRINIVTHQEIFPDTSVLPTYNSHAIELFLHRIPGLAEHFLAMNDDFFLGHKHEKEISFLGPEWHICLRPQSG